MSYARILTALFITAVFTAAAQMLASVAAAAGCRADLDRTRIVKLGGEPVALKCGADCRVIEAETTALQGAVPQMDAAASDGWVVAGAAADRRTSSLSFQWPRVEQISGLWVRYRSGAKRPIPVKIEMSGQPAAADLRGSLPVSTTFRWEPLTTSDGRIVSLARAATGIKLTAELSDQDTIDCLAVTGSAPIPGVSSLIEIDKVWTGTRVGFDAVQVGHTVFVGYYDAERWLTVARVDMNTGRVERRQLDERFNGWDSHNNVELAFDGEGRLHVAANMHASPLVYFSTSQPGAIETLARTAMISRDETRVTYPTFLEQPNGQLTFIYRDGVSGNGVWFANVLEKDRWRRLLGEPLFAERDSSGPVSAYPSSFVPFPDGTVRVAVMWRRPGDVARNFRITLHITRDFRTWTNSTGRVDRLPLGPGSGDLVDDPGENAGLFNGHKLSAAPDGRSVISYTKYGSDGRNIIVLRVRHTTEWTERLIDIAPKRVEIRGSGTIGNAPAVRALDFSDVQRPTIAFALPGVAGLHQVDLDPKTLAPASSAVIIQHLIASALSGERQDLVGQVFLEQAVKEKKTSSTENTTHVLIWTTQGTFGDRPRRCTQQEPKACAPPPAVLRLVTLAR